MELAEDNVEAVERYVQWLYSRDFKISPVGNTQCTNARYLELIRLYVLADKFNIPLLKNHIMGLLFETIKLPNGAFRDLISQDLDIRPPVSVLRLIYTNTPKGSPVRKFIAAFFVWHTSVIRYEEEACWGKMSEIPDFTIDIAINLAKRVDNRVDPLKDIMPFMEPIPKTEIADGLTEPVKSPSACLQVLASV
ncbi:MAG: hypothetical protein Q9205_003551 [Flavoplaca limonia]